MSSSTSSSSSSLILLRQDDTDAAIDAFTQADITEILTRNTKQINLAPSDAATAQRAATFSRATFSVAEADEGKTDATDGVDVNADDYWQKLLPEAAAAATIDQRIIDEPRQRTAVARYHPKDFEADDRCGGPGTRSAR